MSGIDRRRFLGVAAGMAGAAAMPGMAWANRATAAARGEAAADAAADATAGFYRFALGDVSLTVLSDGWFRLPSEIFGANVTEEERTSFYEEKLLPDDMIPLRSNPVIVEVGGRRVLIDAGSGVSNEAGRTVGRLLDSMAAAGIEPASVDLAVVTHAHGDHIDGLIRRDGSGVSFPNVEVVISDTEHAQWTAPDVERRVPPWVVDAGIVAGNRVAFGALGDRVRTVRMDGDIGSGLRGVPTPGHTPGHMAVMVDGGSEPLVLLGDAVVNLHTQMAHPEWHLSFDQDPAEGARTRRRLLDMLATDRLLVHGFHLPFPGIGRVLREGSAYRWMPVI